MAIILWYIRKDSAHFLKKYTFLVPLDFLKIKTLPRAHRNSSIFIELTS